MRAVGFALALFALAIGSPSSVKAWRVEGHQIIASNVSLTGVDDDELIERAHKSCPFSTLLGKAGVEVTITHS